jgi:putative transposase
MANRSPIAVGEWYHCFNRGVDKRRIFESDADYKRFLTLLYICNGTKNIRLSDRYNPSFEGVLSDTSFDRGEPLIELGVYTLMPNHFHLVCREIHEGGIAMFMQKVSTGYTMYFNKKRQRTGALLAGSFKSKHIGEDRYFKKVVAYVLLNHAELFEPAWKEGKGNIQQLKEKLLQYPYSSLPEFFGTIRLQGKIVSSLSDYYDQKLTLANMAQEAHEYYRERSSKV